MLNKHYFACCLFIYLQPFQADPCLETRHTTDIEEESSQGGTLHHPLQCSSVPDDTLPESMLPGIEQGLDLQTAWEQHWEQYGENIVWQTWVERYQENINPDMLDQVPVESDGDVIGTGPTGDEVTSSVTNTYITGAESVGDKVTSSATDSGAATIQVESDSRSYTDPAVAEVTGDLKGIKISEPSVNPQRDSAEVQCNEEAGLQTAECSAGGFDLTAAAETGNIPADEVCVNYDDQWQQLWNDHYDEVYWDHYKKFAAARKLAAAAFSTSPSTTINLTVDEDLADKSSVGKSASGTMRCDKYDRTADSETKPSCVASEILEVKSTECDQSSSKVEASETPFQGVPDRGDILLNAQADKSLEKVTAEIHSLSRPAKQQQGSEEITLETTSSTSEDRVQAVESEETANHNTRSNCVESYTDSDSTECAEIHEIENNLSMVPAYTDKKASHGSNKGTQSRKSKKKGGSKKRLYQQSVGYILSSLTAGTEKESDNDWLNKDDVTAVKDSPENESSVDLVKSQPSDAGIPQEEISDEGGDRLTEVIEETTPASKDLSVSKRDMDTKRDFVTDSGIESADGVYGLDSEGTQSETCVIGVDVCVTGNDTCVTGDDVCVTSGDICVTGNADGIHSMGDGYEQEFTGQQTVPETEPVDGEENTQCGKSNDSASPAQQGISRDLKDVDLGRILE